MHHTKNKGDLGVLKAQADLAEQGCAVLIPLTEHAAFDIVIYKDGSFKRVQVKYRSLSRHGTIDIAFKSSWSDRNGTHIVPVDKTEVDVYCIYCPDTDKCYYFQPQWFGKSVSLRVQAPKNNQNSGVLLADDYRRAP